CRLRPGVPGLSERIRVVSILGRFLEHARIFYFANDGHPEYFIGSADWRARNVRRRVEVIAPVVDAMCCARLDAILERELADASAWQLMPDGSYARARDALSSSSVAQTTFAAEAQMPSTRTAPAQQLAGEPVRADSVVVTPGSHYQAGAFARLLFGETYRPLWMTPIKVP